MYLIGRGMREYSVYCFCPKCLLNLILLARNHAMFNLYNNNFKRNMLIDIVILFHSQHHKRLNYSHTETAKPDSSAAFCVHV